MSFVQLEVMSTNTLMTSTMTVEELVVQAKARGYSAIALTDYNVLYGAIEFYELALKHGLQPLLGLKLDIESYHQSEKHYPLLLLAKNHVGFSNLIQLSTDYQFSKNQAIPLAKLIERAKDLIVITPGEHSEIVELLDQNKIDLATELSQYYMEVFPSFYQGISLQNYQLSRVNLMQDLNLPLVALGNVQYLDSEDALPSRVLQVLDSGISLQAENQNQIKEFLSQQEGDYSLKTAAEMNELFENIGLAEAAKQTVAIAEQIEIDLPLGQHYMPSYPLAEGIKADDFLRKICEENLPIRVSQVNSEYTKRLEKELDVIAEMGFSDYFLIVWDIMQYAHQNDIYTGSGRGSAAGSLVAYLLKITNVDPIQFDLLFERFLNKDRASLPDIDLDFPDNRREEILQYILEKYGTANVAQIGTIGKFGAKSAIRDVGRVFGLTQAELKKWAKAIPSRPNVSLHQALEQPQLTNLIKESTLNQTIFQTALKVEGSNRHLSTHAAGIVISDEELVNRVPLQKGSSSMHLTQYTMEAVEKVGLLKLDILGLRNLATLADCIRFIPYETKGKTVDIDSIPLDDEKTFALFQKGDTDGIFQFESAGIRQQLRKLKPTSFEDIVALNALYRPGPMQQIDTFIRRKQGIEKIKYPHPDLTDILKNTYGVIVYQEQVMKVATELAGYTLNEADILRRAISQKDHVAIELGRKEFVQGAVNKNYSEKTAIAVYEYIEKFADYGFNRSHAVAYSKVAYQLAYVKANYPASFFAAIMKTSSKEKIQTYLAAARQVGVKMIAPDINKSFSSFLIEDGQILTGFNMIKGISKDFIQEIITERERNGRYLGLIDFTKRLDKRWLTEENIKPLIYSGALDSLEKNRHTVIHSLTNVLENVQMSHGNEALIQLFAPKIIEKDELADEVKMEQEFTSTGLYFTKEPGEKYNDLRTDKNIQYIADINQQKKMQLLVVIKNIKTIQTKHGEPMSFIDAVDPSGKISLTLFPENHRRYIQSIQTGDTVLVTGSVSEDSHGIKLLVDNLIHAKKLLNERTKKPIKNETEEILFIRFESLEDEQKKFLALQKILKEYPGKNRVNIYNQKTGQQKFLKEEFNVNLQSEVVNKLKKMFGPKNIVTQQLNINK